MREGVVDLSRISYYLGDHTVLANVVDGPLMFLDTRDPVNVAIMVLGYWEDWISKTFRSVVKPGMTVLDIGAHHGYFSLLAGMLVGPTGVVHAFEPNPFHHKNFLKSVSLNGMYGRVKLNKVLLSNETGEIEIATCGEGGTSIQFLGLEEINGVTKMTVPQGALTDYLPSLKADVIKIDIDGAEPLIMDSLCEVIDHNGSMFIFMEYVPSIWQKGHEPMSVLQRFVDRGFAFHILQRDGQAVPTNAEALIANDTAEQIDLLLMR